VNVTGWPKARSTLRLPDVQLLVSSWVPLGMGASVSVIGPSNDVSRPGADRFIARRFARQRKKIGRADGAHHAPNVRRGAGGEAQGGGGSARTMVYALTPT
jgi:hypothetical protein